MILFAKAPVPGRVKTRLAALLGAKRAAALHSAFVRDTLAKLGDFDALADIELHTDIATDAWGDLAVARRLQCEGNLTLKIIHALKCAFGEHRRQVMILGSDSPSVPHFNTALWHAREKVTMDWLRAAN